MANIRELIQSIEANDSSFDEKLDAINKMEETLVAMRQQEEQAVQDNVDLIVEAIKVMESKVTAQLEVAKSIVPEKGDKGDKGDSGLDGRQGLDGKNGLNGRDGKDGIDGKDGVSVADAKIDFDGSLVITLSTGQEINVGEVVAPDLAEKIKVISTMSTNGAITVKEEGTSLTSGVKSINFVGTGVTATTSGDDVTVTVSGGGGGGSGTVTSVAATVPSFLSVAGSPITTSGTLAITLSGTALPIANGGTGAITSNAAMANLMGFTSTVTAAGTTTLTNTSSYYQLFTGTTTQTVVLPVTSTLQTGWTFHICNNSTGTVTVQSSGLNTVISVIAGTTVMCTCIGTTLTTAADWEAGYTDFSTSTGSGAVVLQSAPVLVAPTFSSPTVTGTMLFSGTASSTSNFHTTQTSGVMTIGGTAGTGNIIFGRSTVSQQTDIQAGATASGSTKTINFGSGGLAGSITAITIGSTAGTSTTTINGTTTLGTALAVSSGGTGQTTASAAFNALSPITTVGDLILGSGTNTATRLAIGANGTVLSSNGTTATWVAGGGGITSGTAVTSTSGTSIDFTSIPSSAKRITILFQSVSTSATSTVGVRLGTGATPTYVTTGYLSVGNTIAGTGVVSSSYTTLFGLGSGNQTAASSMQGKMVITNITGNNWIFSGTTSQTNTNGTHFGNGSLSLGAVLTAVRITTVNGTDTFDAGTINILYE